MEYTNVKGLVTGVSDIAFGTATSTLEDEAKIHDMLDYYVSIGGNYIDTSRFYGRGSGIQHTEELLGRWLAKGDNRSKVIIQSKCCNPEMDHTLTGVRTSRAWAAPAPICMTIYFSAVTTCAWTA